MNLGSCMRATFGSIKYPSDKDHAARDTVSSRLYTLLKRLLEGAQNRLV